MLEQKITFNVVDNKERKFPYVGLSCEKLTRSIGYMQNKFDVVIDRTRIKVVFNYPEHTIELVPLFGAQNFTRVGLAKAISVMYQQIYDSIQKYNLEDLNLYSVTYYPEQNLCLLDVRII